MSLIALQKAIELGLVMSILSLGVFITFRILNIPDLSVDGSITTGAAISAICCLAHQPLLGLVLGMLGGCLCGLACALLQTHFRIQPLLAGILVMTGLYSVNLRIMGGKPNISLWESPTLFDGQNWLVLLVIVGVVYMLVYAFFQTHLGLMIRATGDNEAMVKSSSINVVWMKWVAFALANGLVGLSGAVLAQYNGFADVTGGTGMMVIGLAGIIVGEALLHRKTIVFGLLASLVGAIAYRLIYTLALQLGVSSSDMNLVSALLVALTISLPVLKKRRRSHASL